MGGGAIKRVRDIAYIEIMGEQAAKLLRGDLAFGYIAVDDQESFLLAREGNVVSNAPDGPQRR